MPRKPGPDLLRVPPGRLRGAVPPPTCARRRGRRASSASAATSPPRSTSPRAGRVPIVIHEENPLPGLANKLAARFTRTSTRRSRRRRCRTPVSGCRCAARSPGSTGPPCGRRADGVRADPDLPTLLVTGGSQGASRSTSRHRRRATAAGRHPGPARPRSEEPHRQGAPTEAETGAVYVPAGLRRADGAGIRRRRPDAGPGRRQHRDGDRGGRAARGLRALPFGNGEQARNAAAVVEAGGGLLLEDADCTADWVAASAGADRRPDPAGRDAAARCRGRDAATDLAE